MIKKKDWENKNNEKLGRRGRLKNEKLVRKESKKV